jgi:hypothetical protein
MLGGDRWLLLWRVDLSVWHNLKVLEYDKKREVLFLTKAHVSAGDVTFYAATCHLAHLKISDDHAYRKCRGILTSGTILVPIFL